uniref:Endonuclease-reverse transcriptase n=1 Tax=Rhodnius prolixus TaxID=13249 RepID=T1I926_RHOPR
MPKDQKELSKFEEKLLAEIKEMRSGINSLNDKFEALSSAYVTCKEECESLKKVVSDQSTKIKYLEKQLKRKNLIFWGIPEIKDETNVRLEETMIDLLREKLQIELLPNEVSSIRRFGRPRDHIRPICMELVSEKRKIEILKSSSGFKGSKMGVSLDFPKDVAEERKKLKPFYEKAKQEGHKVKMIGDKLLLRNKLYSLSDLKEDRSLSAGTVLGMNNLVKQSDAKKEDVSSPLKNPLHLNLRSHSRDKASSS